MEHLFGKSAYEGVVIGSVYVENNTTEKDDADDIPVYDIQSEKEKLDMALESAISSLEGLKTGLTGEIEKKDLDIIDAHLLLLKDPVYIKDIEVYIEKNLKRADKAVKDVTEKYLGLFKKIDSPIYRQRELDIKDVSNRLLDILRSDEENHKILDGKILVTREIYPTELLKIYKEKIALKGIVMEYGGETSHVAILAKALKIPTLMGVDNIFAHQWNGDIILDTTEDNSCVILNPDENEIEKYTKKQEKMTRRIRKINECANLPAITKDGVEINLYLNIGDSERHSDDDVDKTTVEGVGLLRTELIYMKSSEFPSEEKQLYIYREILKDFSRDQSIVIRTLDIGADKQLSYFKMHSETNPFLGLRGIRFSFENEDIFKIQLRAILRLSNEKNIKIMYPMITNLDEVDRANSILDEVKDELRRENIPFNENIEVGIMVEVPSVVLMAEEFAQKIDFFSIGSNDLTQYILAADRLSETVGDMYDSFNPAVLRGIKIIKDAADKYGKKVSVCGEMAGDPRAVVALLSIGIKDLSMVETSIPMIKALIRNLNYQELVLLKNELLKCGNPEKVKNLLKEKIMYLD